FVGGDAVEPGAQGGAALEADESAPSGKQRLLEHVFCVLRRAEDAVAVGLQLAPKWLDELAERVLVPVAGARDRWCGHCGSPAASGVSFPITALDPKRSANSSRPVLWRGGVLIGEREPSRLRRKPHAADAGTAELGPALGAGAHLARQL